MAYKELPIPYNLWSRFLIEGRFPEVWSLPDWEAKQSYLFGNYVEKVILEDPVLALELSDRRC